MSNFDSPKEPSDGRPAAPELQQPLEDNLVASAYSENSDTDSADANGLETFDSKQFESTDTDLGIDQSEVTEHIRNAELTKSINPKVELPSLTIDFSPPLDISASEKESGLPNFELANGLSESRQELRSYNGEAGAAYRRSTGKGPGQESEESIPEKSNQEVDDSEGPYEIELPPAFDRESGDAGVLDATDASDKPLESDQEYWADKPRLTRDEMLKKASEHLENPEELKSFNENLEAFENRARKDGVSTLERETFYGQVGKVLDASASGNDFYKGEQLETIASAMMKHAGFPGSVNQGTEPTCTTAALESVLYAKEPNTVGEVVSEAALTGQYVTASGDTIKIPERNLMPDKYKADTPEEKARSLASHIFQPLSINMKWNRQDSYFDQTGGKKGNLVYEEGHPKEHPGDIQSRIMDYSKTPAEPVTEEVYLSDPIRDKNAPGFSIPELRPANAPMMFMDDLPKIYSDLKGNEGSLTTTNIEKGENVETPQSKEEFEKLFEQAAANDGNIGPSFPMLLGVHANLEPFNTDLHEYSNNRSEEDKRTESAMHAHHAVAIFDYDPETKMVELENQWGPKADHTGEDGRKEKIHIDDLYRTFKGLLPEESQKLKKAEPVKEPTPDEIIDSQREFVEEIAADEDQNPEKVWQERRELYRRLNHFGRDEEAAEQRDILMKDFEKLSKGQDYENVARMGGNLISSLRGANENDLVNTVVDKLDETFIDSVSDKPDLDTRDQADGLLRLHESLGDQDGKSELLDKYLAKTIGDGTKLDIGDSRQRSIMFDNLSLAHLHGDADMAKQSFGTIVKSFRTFESENGNKSTAALEAKGDILYQADRMGAKGIANELAGEMQSVYDELNQEVDNEEEFEAEPLTDVRLSLRSHYIKTKQPDKLEPIIEDYMRYHEELKMVDGKPQGSDSEQLIGPLNYMGRRLREGGAIEKSAEYLERSLELTRKHEPDDAGRVALDLASAYLQLGREDEAEKLINEFDLPGIRFRRYRQK